MSKPDSPRGLRAVDDLIAEAQIDRIASMTGPELDDALRSQGLDPDAAWDLEKMLPEEPITSERPAGAEAPAKTESPPGTAPPPRTAPVAVLRPRSRWNLWLVAASFSALGVCAVVAALQSTPGVAGNGEGPQSPVTASALAKAEALRDEAGRACQHELWSLCARALDQAKALDPEGEKQERVEQWRALIAGHESPLLDSKPGPDPRRRPR
jgi:hypothetical protein